MTIISVTTKIEISLKKNNSKCRAFLQDNDCITTLCNEIYSVKLNLKYQIKTGITGIC